MENPWNVSSLENFLHFCCPECDMKSKNSQEFVKHANEDHNQLKQFKVDSDHILIEESNNDTSFEDFNGLNQFDNVEDFEVEENKSQSKEFENDTFNIEMNDDNSSDEEIKTKIEEHENDNLDIEMNDENPSDKKN